MKINEKHIGIIEYLLKYDRPVTAKQLSLWNNHSIRSVKNYISDIQKTTDKPIIISTFQGYTVDKEQAKIFIDSNKRNRKQNRPEDYQQRARYINEKFFKYKVTKLDIYELADEIGFSVETVKQDISKMNKTYSNYKVVYQLEGNFIKLICKEEDLRSFAMNIVYEEIDGGMFDIETIRKAFPLIDTEAIRFAIISVLNNNNLYVNDFSLVNLILHLAIIVNRLIVEKHIENSNREFFERDELVLASSKNLCEMLEDHFNIIFNDDEVNNVYLLLKANVNVIVKESRREVIEYVGDKLFDYTQEIINKLNDKYYINLNSQSFLYPFAMHIKNLIFRLENGKVNVTPIADLIRYSHPIVFDMAVNIGVNIHNTFGFQLSKDELALIALHIGGEIERQSLAKEKIKTVLVSPNYLGISTQLYNQILMNFGNDLELIGNVNDEQLLTNYVGLDMIITVIPLNKQYDNVVEISLIGFNDSKEKIQNKIFDLKKKQRYQILDKNFNSFFSKELFIDDLHLGSASAYEIIKTMSDIMYQQGVVNESFYSNLMERELASTTAFPNIAIPHSMKMDAIKTSVSVMICPKGVKWGGQNVKLVFCIAINKIDSYLFGELYQAIIEMFDSEENLEKLMGVKTFEQFENVVRSLI